MSVHKSGRVTSAKVGLTRNFVVFAGELTDFTQCRSLGTSLAVHSPELGDVRYSGVSIIHKPY